MKLQDSELKIMNVLWKRGDLPARRVAEILTEQVGWNVNTTYTLIKRCIGKGAIERREPHFVCHALVSQQQVQYDETEELIQKIFDGSADKLFASLLSRKRLSDEQIANLRRIIDEMK